MRFVASADWQLGMTASYLNEDARPRFRQARLEAIRRIGGIAADRDAAFVLVCGDVFESNQLDRQVVARAFEALKDVPVPVYLLPGNHDPMDASSIYRSTEFERGCPDHVHVLAEPGVTTVADGVEIVAAPWFNKRPLTDLVAHACADLEPSTGVVRVVAGHGATDTLNPDRDDVATIAVDALDRVLTDGRAHFAVLGDRHSTTRVADRIWYPGAPEVTARDESEPGNVLVVDLPDGGTGHANVESVRVGEWSFVDHAHVLTGLEDVRALDAWLEALPSKELTAVWLRLSGTLSVHHKAVLDDMLEHHELLLAALTVWRRHYDLSVLPDDADFGDLGLTGFAEDAVAELAATAASGGDGAATAQDALGLLYRLTGGGR